MTILKTGVSGLGRIGWSYHLPEIAKHEGFSLTAVTDASPERLAEAEQSYGINAYEDFKEMVDREALDLVVIASPTIFHMEQAIYAMEHGVDVFLEKPMAGSLDEVDAIIHVMKKYGRRLIVYQPHRTTPEYQAVKSIIESNKLGPIYMIKRGSSQYSRRNDWQSMKKYGGGMLNNYGAHYIDQTLCLAGSSARNISCSLKKIASLGDADDVVKLVIETDNDITLDIDINMASAVELAPWILLGQYGSAVMKHTNNGDLFNVRFIKKDELLDLSVNQELVAPGRSYGNEDHLIWHEETIQIADFKPIDFYEQCRNYFALGEPSFIPVEDTREVMRVIEECRKNDVN